MSGVTDTRIQELLDHQAINHILTLYARAIDRCDIELLKSIYHPDARDDHASFKGTAREFADHVIAYLGEMFTATMHHVTHSNIELHGDSAAAESYYFAYHRLEGDFDKVTKFFGRTYAEKCRAEGTLEQGHEFICSGRYVDVFTRVNGEWKIADREITVEWKHSQPANHGDPGSDIEGIVAPPRRDRQDIAYRAIQRARAGR